MCVGNFYNLAMGHIDETGDIDVFSKSNNGDMEAILATVIKIITHFLNIIPMPKYMLREVLLQEPDSIKLQQNRS